MANPRVPYQVNGNVVGTLISLAVSKILQANDAVNRLNSILVAIGSPEDVETALGMAAGSSYGAALQAIISGAKTNLNTVAADMGRLDQG